MSRLERQRRRRRHSGGPGRILFVSLGVLFTLLGVMALSFVGWIVSVANSGPSLGELQPQDKGATSVVFAADGTRLGVIQSEILRTPIASSAIPQVMKDATVAIEDRRFFEHKGVDLEGIIRAAVKNIESGGDTVQGGSTLTMQLVRNLYTGDSRRSGLEGYKRKIREARLAEELEDRHPGPEGKRWILSKYINSVPYGTVGGQTAVGVSAAARVFFNKPAGKLDLHEAALLAGLPQAPSLYNPFNNADRALARRNDVLRRMADEGYISDAQASEAMARDLDVRSSRFYTQRSEGYFFDYVRQQLIDEYGVEKVREGGLRVYTTLDRRRQRVARQELEKAVAGRDRAAAIVSVDPRNGHIIAMASSAKYGEFKFNLASQGRYQAGSTFKIMALMDALRKGVSPTSTSYTSMPLKFTDPAWGPIDVKTYSNSYIGRANLVRATTTSDNSIYQQLALDLGPKDIAETAHDMGIKSALKGYPSETLGAVAVSPLEMANSYATIASGGWRNRVTAITKVCSPTGTQQFKCQRMKPRRHKAFSDGVTYEATKIMVQNVLGGTGTSAQIGCPAAGKTGTTDDYTDAWFVGYTPRLSTAVWVGHATDKRTLGPGSAGGTVAAPIWGAYMRSAKGGFCGDFPKPQEAFVAKPFNGKYSQRGVKDNRAAGGYTIDQGDAQELETGDRGGDGGSGRRNSGNYEAPPQGPPANQEPQQPVTPEPQGPQQESPGFGVPENGGAGAPPPP